MKKNSLSISLIMLFPFFAFNQLNAQNIQVKKWESTQISGKMIYLNGVNISSIRNEELKNVSIKIDANGNIYIIAPQYEVNEDSTYHPLLPSELPKFPKASMPNENFPKQKYSKETGMVSEIETQESQNKTPAVQATPTAEKPSL